VHIAIIGAGFTGTALAANLHALHTSEITISLIEKRNSFGLGEAYSTPYWHHLLNVRAKEMSAFEEDATHFMRWLQKNAPEQVCLNDLPDHFAPRLLYGRYLQSLLDELQHAPKLRLNLVQDEAIGVESHTGLQHIKLKKGNVLQADKVVLATGNGLPSAFPFPVTADFNQIADPWDFTAPVKIPSDAAVMIVGTGLSMIDAVLTLHQQQHRGKIYGLSRHGLLPLRHTSAQGKLELSQPLPSNVKFLISFLKAEAERQQVNDIDWRLVINGFRVRFPDLWKQASLDERKRFLRHALVYWNIHRHRVDDPIADILEELQAKHQLEIIAGHLKSAQQRQVFVAPRGKQHVQQYQVDWLINCMGPAMRINKHLPLIHSLLTQNLARLDPLQLGFDIADNFALIQQSGKISNQLYTIGPPAKGINWTCSSVPEIRRQCAALAKHLLAAH